MIIYENNCIKKAGKIKAGEKLLVYNDRKYKWEKIKEIKKEIIKDKVMTIELKGELNTFLVSIDGRNFILSHSGYNHINIFMFAAKATTLTISLILIQPYILNNSTANNFFK